MSALSGNKAVSKEFKTVAAPALLDDKAWQAELEQNTAWVEYHRTVMQVIQNGHPRAPEQQRAAAVLKLAEYIEKNSTSEAAATLGAQAFAYAQCEVKGYIEREAFDVEFASAGLKTNGSVAEREGYQFDMEEASEKLVQHLGEQNTLAIAQKHVSAEDFGVALMARLLARASNGGFKGEAQALRTKLEANFEVAEAVGNAVRSGAGDYFNFSVMTDDGKPKAPAFLVVPKSGTQYIN